MRKLYYNSYILPIIDYGIILWQYAPKRKLITIANIQKRTARTILDKSWDHPSNPLFKELNWLPLHSRITYHVALLFFFLKLRIYLASLYYYLLQTVDTNYPLNPDAKQEVILY